ncbi:SIMPL domain-containing protein [Bradyrhizobium sp. WBOS7]|uniref:SIMPL domain-containing protein n=1 Tax=Bradyrhizobium betae TaxID=244734 RepID=A0AAE9N983_9BRAD|nr:MULTISPECIES: SIMPL domain-containing protein [Bradyrhizobium]MDD1575061.1 SIMPL domain-containing protein [Bradyrhizobium sp. WBOS1]UUO33854.1 SIMPL domain-containing protein [Bradyrhizobium sp. WBOS01]MDD1531848.1 SIMPL domain-containing protein [Bradyrhizobium sp. WBOS2]MDD1581281.1 SIMPL domain-containing protein [Bradyrhizobium sp. WBOS7]MDD1604669.1 SIMPL domain-containing protein [Bradyrhizobium sp. WBOS16]
MRIMKNPAILAASLAAVVAAALPATPALADDFPSAISVSGEANVSVAPDLAQIDAGVANDAKTAKEASDANNAAMGKVLLALKGAGIAEKDYQTSRLSLQPQYGQNRSTGASPVVGFRASNRVTVKIRDVTKVAAIIDTLVGAGANDIGHISFEVTQASKLLDDAREQAVADARRKAEIYAKATGVTLGAPLSVSEGGAPVPLFKPRMADRMAAAPQAAVAPGEETLSVTVNVSWAIKQGQ